MKEEANKTENLLILALLNYFGMRVTELVKLRMRNLDLAGKTIVIEENQKSGRASRVLTLPNGDGADSHPLAKSLHHYIANIRPFKRAADLNPYIFFDDSAPDREISPINLSQLRARINESDLTRRLIGGSPKSVWKLLIEFHSSASGEGYSAASERNNFTNAYIKRFTDSANGSD